MRRGCATSANHASQSPHCDNGSFHVAPPSTEKKSSLSPQPIYSAGTFAKPYNPARLIGAKVSRPIAGFQLWPPSPLQNTPPSLAIQIVPPRYWSRTLLLLYGELTPPGSFMVMLKSVGTAIGGG